MTGIVLGYTMWAMLCLGTGWLLVKYGGRDAPA